ncbi:hypothetical protein Tco_0486533 [Tanacetum coccineum]
MNVHNSKTSALIRTGWWNDEKCTMEDLNVIHFDNSSDLPLSTSLNDLNNATLHIDGQSTEVDAPPDIIDLDEDDDIIDDEDALPHDLANSDDVRPSSMLKDMKEYRRCQRILHGATAVTVAVMIVPLHTIYLPVAGVASLTDAPVKPILCEGKAADSDTPRDPKPSGLKKITDDKGPVPNSFEWDDKKTMMPLGDHASHWSNYLGELIREMPLYYLTLQRSPAERKRRSDVPRALPRQIGMPRLHFGMIPGTKPEPLKIAKTEQRARSFAGRDPESLALSYRDEMEGDGESAGAAPTSNTDRSALPLMKRSMPWLERATWGTFPVPFRSDDKFSQMLRQYESTPEFGSGSGGCGDDEIADDEDGGEDEEDEEDGDS